MSRPSRHRARVRHGPELPPHHPGQPEPDDEVLERVDLQDRPGIAAADHVGGPGERDPPGPVGGVVERRLQFRSPRIGVDGQLRTELPVVARRLALCDRQGPEHRQALLKLGPAEREEGGESRACVPTQGHHGEDKEDGGGNGNPPARRRPGSRGGGGGRGTRIGRAFGRRGQEGSIWPTTPGVGSRGSARPCPESTQAGGIG